MRIATLSLLALVLTGCIAEDRERTIAQCQLEHPVPDNAAIGPAVASTQRLILCMRQQGYEPDDTNRPCWPEGSAEAVSAMGKLTLIATARTSFCYRPTGTVAKIIYRIIG